MAEQKHVYREVRTRERSLVKSLTYRIFIIVSDVVVLYLLTRDVTTTAAFTIVSNAVTTVEYYFHERLWSRTTWGLKRVKVKA